MNNLKKFNLSIKCIFKLKVENKSFRDILSDFYSDPFISEIKLGHFEIKTTIFKLISKYYKYIKNIKKSILI